MRVRIVDLLANSVLPDDFVEFRAPARIVRQRVLIKWRFEIDETLRQSRIEHEIQLAAFQDALGRTEEKYFILPDRPAEIRGRIPTIEEWRATRRIRNVARIEGRAPVEDRQSAVPIIRTATRHNVYHTSRRVTKFRLVSSRDHLEFHDRILIELRRGTPIEVVAIGQAVN